MADYLESAEATLKHYQKEGVHQLALWQVEIDIQVLCSEFADFGLEMCEADCETLATLYRIRRNLRISLEADRQRAIAKQIADDEINFDALCRRLS